jgi:hypothetical protein
MVAIHLPIIPLGVPDRPQFLLILKNKNKKKLDERLADLNGLELI